MSGSGGALLLFSEGMQEFAAAVGRCVFACQLDLRSLPFITVFHILTDLARMLV